MENFLQQLKSDARVVEMRLAEIFRDTVYGGEICRPPKLMSAIRHGVLNGGKRLRPFLVMESGRMLGAVTQNLVQIAIALECIHSYSLIHDDLPAMDDDDLRRGKPTVHKAFDEATAILAGDALLTYAFELLADNETHDDPAIRIKLITKLANAAGLGGMVGGQILDLDPLTTSPSQTQIKTMQQMKTGALIEFACEAGAICANASTKETAALAQYGSLIGQAFQLADDILDVTATASQMGKNTSKDLEQGKLTQVSILGVDEATTIAKELVEKACDLLSIFGDRAQILKEAAAFTISRDQ